MSTHDPNQPYQQGPVPPPPPPGGPAPQPGYTPAPGYEGMPSYAPGPGYPTGPVTRPRAMDLAVRLMQLGGVLSLISPFFTLLFRDSIEDAARRNSNPGPADREAFENGLDIGFKIAMAIGTFMAIVLASLWFLMAWANGRGMAWARILASVFFAISVLYTAFSAIAGSFLASVPSVIATLIGAAAIFLMYKKESSAFYEASSRRM